MRLINYSHPITPTQKLEIENYYSVHNPIEITQIPVQVNLSEDLEPQVLTLIQAANLQPELWSQVYINLPGHSTVAALMTAHLLQISKQLHIIRLKPIATATQTVYDLAEIIHFRL